MKYLSILILSLIVSSCCGTKKAIESQPEPTNVVAVATEVPIALEPPPIPTPSEPLQPPESPPRIAKKDSITKDLSFHQDVTKRILTEHQLWDELLKKYVSDGGNVDYFELKNDHKDLYDYIKILQITHEKINLKTIRSDSELLAYWINAYNAFTIDLILRNYPLKTIKDIKDPWDQRLWKLGDNWYNLNDIEHKILRKMNEPRIHFAIVCASESCPKLLNQAFTASKLEEQLTNATKEFLSDTSKNNITQNNLKLSKIFKWFKKDFEQNGSLIDFLNQYSDITISKTAKRSYKDYNWDLNE